MYRAERPASREPRGKVGEGLGRLRAWTGGGGRQGAGREHTGEGQVTLCVYTEFW